MRLFPEASIRRQLIFWLVLPLSIALICSALVVYKLALDFVTEAYDRALYDSALDLSRRLRLRDGRLFVDLPPAAADMLEIDELDRVYYAVRSDSGELVIGQGDLPQPESSHDIRPQYLYATYRDQPIRLVALRVPYDPDDEHALALVLVAETLIRRQLLGQDILIAVALSQLVLIAMIVISVYLGVGHGLLALVRLRQQIESRSHRDLTPLDEPHTPREVRPLVHAINALMQRLQRAIMAQQKFIADAAHQLRTPLAGLKTHAELALREQSLASMRERVRALMLATDRSAHLAHQLLSLARAEPEAGSVAAMARIDLDRLVKDVAADWVPLAIERRLDLGVNLGAAPIAIHGNAVLVRELLGNLIDNALRYTPPGGRVTVAVERQDAQAVLSVEDNGSGIPAGEHTRVFERFQRLGHGAAEGCGLGLAIVREIANLHAASIDLTEGAGGAGTRVSVRFKLAAASEPAFEGAASA
ncbi:MAG: sensor histidine kinase N-terminal domain-containing protein [Burkholderiales bacterium]|nr:sensor histidine kinase N-terminal domain-containing protein [Burkholderiales bacterium]